MTLGKTHVNSRQLIFRLRLDYRRGKVAAKREEVNDPFARDSTHFTTGDNDPSGREADPLPNLVVGPASPIESRKDVVTSRVCFSGRQSPNRRQLVVYSVLPHNPSNPRRRVLVGKERQGTTIRKRCDTVMTPYPQPGQACRGM